MDARLDFAGLPIESERVDGSALALDARACAATPVDLRPMLDDAKAVIPSAALAALTGVISMVVIWVSGMAKDPVRLAYVGAAVTVLQLAILTWAGIEFWRTAKIRAPNPARVLAARLRDRLLLLALPTLVLPLFLASYTINKTGIAFLVGFHFDQLWADIDHAVFGVDPWRITHAVIGVQGTRFLEFFYAIGWGLVLAFVAPLISLYGSVRFVGRFYLALLLTWFVGGNVLAYGLASAGPVLSHNAMPSLALRFAPLRASLDQLLPADSMIRATQDYLSASVHQPFVIMGGGISAMPSMHIATVTLYILAARGTRWVWPAQVFAALIFVGAIHFGFHYVCDALAGAAVAWLGWRASGCWFRRFHDAPGILTAPKTGQALPEMLNPR